MRDRHRSRSAAEGLPLVQERRGWDMARRGATTLSSMSSGIRKRIATALLVLLTLSPMAIP
jgi:hypothetical protein